ncbi:hypothetical protein FOZ61_005352 [Perkinsus olseni]|uniref:SH3 domain-containing protein n=1 Tax=Perkinsus olseni TaxID=32597 RepID=A0A7J6MIX1_PEROL|nr:hypothetical protein FOZ61_005352 [Perkinsus olseni]
MSTTLLDLEDLLGSDKPENSSSNLGNEQGQELAKKAAAFDKMDDLVTSTQPFPEGTSAGEVKDARVVDQQHGPTTSSTTEETMITPIRTDTAATPEGLLSGSVEGIIGEGAKESSSSQSRSLMSSSQLHISLGSIPVSAEKTSPAQTTVPSEVLAPSNSVDADRARIWKIIDKSAEGVTYHLGALSDMGFAMEARTALNRLKDRALAGERDEEDRQGFWNDFKIVYSRLATIPDVERAWQGVVELNRIHEVFSCGINATGEGGMSKRQMEEVVAAAMREHEVRLHEQQQVMLTNLREQIVADVVEEMRKMRRDERAKLAHHIDLRVGDLERSIMAGPLHRTTTGTFTSEDTRNFDHPVETKGQLSQSRTAARSSTTPSRSSRPSTSQPSPSLAEVPGRPRLSAVPSTGIKGKRAVVCENFRKESANELSVGIQELVHILSSKIEKGYVRVRTQGPRAASGFVPAQILSIDE